MQELMITPDSIIHFKKVHWRISIFSFFSLLFASKNFKTCRLQINSILINHFQILVFVFLIDYYFMNFNKKTFLENTRTILLGIHEIDIFASY